MGSENPSQGLSVPGWSNAILFNGAPKFCTVELSPSVFLMRAQVQ